MTNQQVTAKQVQQNIRFTQLTASKSWNQYTAQEQKSIFFGSYLFGRKSIKATQDGIEARVSAGFGTDYSYQEYSWAELAQMINNNWKAGSGGRKFKK